MPKKSCSCVLADRHRDAAGEAVDDRAAGMNRTAVPAGEAITTQDTPAIIVHKNRPSTP
jgi:hypothetical protein